MYLLFSNMMNGKRGKGEGESDPDEECEFRWTSWLCQLKPDIHGFLLS